MKRNIAYIHLNISFSAFLMTFLYFYEATLYIAVVTIVSYFVFKRRFALALMNKFEYDQEAFYKWVYKNKI